jgi:hypothetical protein
MEKGSIATLANNRSLTIWADRASPKSTVAHLSPPSELTRTLIRRWWSVVGLWNKCGQRPFVFLMKYRLEVRIMSCDIQEKVFVSLKDAFHEAHQSGGACYLAYSCGSGENWRKGTVK